MKFTTTIATTLLIGAGLMSTAVMAAGPMAGQWYGGGNIGQSKFKDLCSGFAGPCTDTDTSFKIFGGYTFSPNVSGEIGYLDIGKGKISTGGPTPITANLSGNALYIDAVGNYPLANNFSLLGRIGFANAKAKATAGLNSASDSVTKLHIGVGASYDISPILSLRGEWEQVSDFADNFSVGVAFKF